MKKTVAHTAIDKLLVYLGAAILFTHEMDAVRHAEWRVLPITRWMSESVGESVFIATHVPLFAFFLFFLSHGKAEVRRLTADILMVFLLLHGLLHLLFSSHEHYTFETSLSGFLIFGGSACGLLYWIKALMTGNENKFP